MSDTHATKIVKAEPAEIEPSAPLHPMVVAAMAKDDKLDLAQFEKLMDLQERWEAGESRKAYTRAMARLKAELPRVLERDQLVDYEKRGGGRVRYTHTSLAHVVDRVVDILTAHGFSHSWLPKISERGDRVAVTCRLIHVEGHSEECSIHSTPDQSGGKAGPQAIASTITMLQRYTLLSILGIATADMDEPTGAPAPDPDAIDAQRNLAALAWLKERGVSKEDAEAHVQREISKWTNADLAELKKFGKSKEEQPTEGAA